MHIIELLPNRWYLVDVRYNGKTARLNGKSVQECIDKAFNFMEKEAAKCK